jgi:eukaryotic-like serine/threonine-protein kinase
MSWPQASLRLVQNDVQIGKYRLLTELGSGGMAQVYLALVRGPSGFVKLSVLKLLKDAGGLADEPGVLTMFLNEAQLSARLNHPNVVQTYEVGEEQGRHYLVMEYLEGQPLDRVLRRVRDASARALPCLLRVLCDALAGLHYAHELRDFDGSPLGVVHRDVSASNLFVTYEGQAKVVDFGIAKARRVSSATAAGALKGTLRYMAPEQARGGQGVDRRADVFAVGVLLWEATSGARMWAGHEDVSILHRLLSGDVPRLREVAPDAPEALALICDRALAADADARYPTAHAMRADLERVLETFGPAGHPSALAGLMTELFRDDRERLQSLVERQLSQTLRSPHDLSAPSASSAPASAAPEGQPAWPAPPSALLAEAPASPAMASGPHTAIPTTSPAPAASPPRELARHAPWVLGGLLLVAAASGVAARAAVRKGLLGAGGRPSNDGAAASAAIPPATPGPVAPAAENVELHVETGGVEAEVLLDGRSLGKTPLRVTAPRGGEHELRLEAPGHLTLARRVSLERDVVVEVLLAHAPLPPQEASAPSGPRPRGAPRPERTAAPGGPQAPRPKRGAPPLDTSDPYKQ